MTDGVRLSDAETRVRGTLIATRAILTALVEEARSAWGEEAAARIYERANATIRRTIYKARSEFTGEGAEVPALMDAAAESFLNEVFSEER